MSAVLKIPFSGLARQYHNLRQEILEATDEVLRSGQLMNGNHTAEFENWLARRNGVKYAVAVHSGTQALECLAEYYATEFSERSTNPPRVAIPTLGYVATANAFLRAGWEVYLMDVDSYGIIDVKKLVNLDQMQALVVVGLYGHRIWHLNLIKLGRSIYSGPQIIIEDAAQHWLAPPGERIGPAAISFDPMKNLPCYGNGGAVVTQDSDLLHFARAWRDNGKSIHNQTGTNSRMSEIDCALMMVKTKYIDQWQQRRREIAAHWIERFRNSAIRCLITRENLSEHAVHKFVIDVDHRDSLKKKLADLSIETRIHYESPLHELNLISQCPGPGLLSVGSALCRRVISLPIYPELTDLQVEYVADQVLSCVNN